MAEVHGEGEECVGEEVGEERSGHINICLHPRSSCIHFDYHCFRAANVDNT